MTELTIKGGDVLHTDRMNRRSGVGRRLAAVRAIPNIATFAGLGIVTIGLVLIVVAWAKVAGVTNVALQVPYVISAGFTGLAFVVIGLTVINVAAKRQDGLARTRQLAEMKKLLAELRTIVEEDPR